ncbi:MAG: carbamoyltransferase HypF [bacterium]
MPTLVALVRGRVQGVGFRPFVHRLAASRRVDGWVANTTEGVRIMAQGRSARGFLAELRSHPPPLARITHWAVTQTRHRRLTGFTILASSSTKRAHLDVTPDIAVCPDCAEELVDRANRRRGYPFTNCTQCGPRYSIVTGLPYDRPRTTMAGFRLCPNCRAEYLDQADRRFHAQPVCCPACGPHLYLLGPSGAQRPAAGGDQAVLARSARAIRAGKLVAIKSIGGFQIACRADRDSTVARLRRLKDRPTKPLALMCASVAAARRLARISPAARALLESDRAPVVLLPRQPGAPVSDLVAPGTNRLGVMLPYTPLHRLLFAELADCPALVMTSANRRGEPIALTDRELVDNRVHTSRVPFDLALSHDRPIANRCDDSVVLADERPVLLRRARGYTPEPIALAPMFHVKHPVLAVGADGRNTFALAIGDRLIPGPYLGDMGSSAVETFFESALERYLGWHRARPRTIACDLHPDYHSTRLAERLAERFGTRMVRVQHHLAHILSVMAEHGLTAPVLGLVADGTGYGADGNVWGCEGILVRPGRGWRRVGHLGWLDAVDGGDELADPVRVATGYLAQAGESSLARRLFGGAGPVERPGRLRSSSLGRLFDAAAAITGVCRQVTFEGEAAIALEAAAGGRLARGWYRPADLSDAPDGSGLAWDPRYCIAQLARSAAGGAGASELAARFHSTVVNALSAIVLKLARRHRVGKVALSGGSMVNSLLRRGLELRLERAGLAVYRNEAVPPNDGGVSVGQAIAANALPE